MISQLTQAFIKLNQALFENCLPAEIQFVTNLNRKCILHFLPPKIIEIGSGILDARKDEVIDDLVHVMVHMQNFIRGVSDHTVNQYHNRAFVERAIDVGLTVAYHKTRGWAITSSSKNVFDQTTKVRFPSEKDSIRLAECLQRLSVSEIEFDNFKLALSRDVAAKPQKEYLLKYVCECHPPVIVRSGRRPDGQNPLDITCNNCNTKFVLESERLSSVFAVQSS